jgi:hypothetical protein
MAVAISTLVSALAFMFSINPESYLIQLIAVLNFVTIWWRKQSTNLIAIIIISAQWLFVVLFVAIGFRVHTHPPNDYYSSPVPVCCYIISEIFDRLLISILQFWCWLGARYNVERIAGEYLWFWLALVGSILSYIPLFLWHLGVIDPDSPRWYKPSTGKQHPQLGATIW